MKQDRFSNLRLQGWFSFQRCYKLRSAGDVSGYGSSRFLETKVQDRLKFQRQEGGARETRAESMGSDFD